MSFKAHSVAQARQNASTYARAAALARAEGRFIRAEVLDAKSKFFSVKASEMAYERAAFALAA